jgi:pilus assembly protein CpaB
VFADPRDVIGRVVTTQVMKDQPVMSTLLAPKGAAGGLQAMVPPGMRAVTLEVTEFTGVGGLLAPGSRVDVVQTIQGKVETDPVARTIAENLKVLAVGRRMASVTTAAGTEGEANVAKSVTLLATVEQAQTLDLAGHFGTPRLVLRNGDDTAATGGRGMTVAELRGEAGGAMSALVGLLHGTAATRPVEPEKTEPVSEPVVERPNYREVEVIRGGQSTNVKVSVPERRDVVGGGDQLDRVVPADR